MNSAHDFLRSRRSARRFKPDGVADSVIERILTTASFAPSAHNCQPWRFVIIKTPTIKLRLAKALTDKMRLDMQTEGALESEIETRVERSQRRINEAPLITLLCRDVTAVRVDTPEETVMNIQSTALAGLQLLLAAHAEGLGGNWICWPLYAQEATRAALDLTDTWEPQDMFFIGQPDEEPKERTLNPIDDIMTII